MAITRLTIRHSIYAVVICMGLLSFTEFLHATPQPVDPSEILNEYEILRKQLEVSKNDVAVLNSLGILYARADRINDAILIWKHAMAIDPRYIHLYNNLGSALKSLGKTEEAFLIYKTGLAVSPSHLIHYNLALLHLDLGQHIEGVRSLQQCLALQPDFEPAVRKLRDLGHYFPQTTIPLNGNIKTYSMGYKPPVETGNLGLMPIFPGTNESSPAYGGRENSGLPRIKPGKEISIGEENPISISECINLIERFDVESESRLVALTFDDGPHPTLTTRLLDYLRTENIPATFFVLGSRAETYPHIIARISDEGHEIGNHTWNHKSLTRLSAESALAELHKTDDLITMLTGKSCKLVRPPYGHTNSSTQQLISSQGWHHIMWDADSRDWQLKDSHRIVRRVMKEFFPGCIILFHDIHSGALQSLPTLVPALKKCGYRFVTISQLAQMLNIAG